MADGTRFAGRVFDGSGTAVENATINLYDVGTVTPVRATTTTNSTGDWEIDHATRGLFDIEIVNGTTTRRITQDTEAQFKSMWLWNADADEYALGVTRTEDAASVEVAYFEGDRATPADADLAYISLRLSDSAGNQDEQARIGWSATTVLNGATQDGDLILSALVNNTLTEFMRLDGSAASINFPSGTILDFGSGDVTITPSTNVLTIAGVATRVDLAAGILEMNNAVEWDTGIAVVAAEYSIGRDADGTNQLHFNVPTGATYEWSTNDVSQMVFGAGILFLGDTANTDMTVGLTIMGGGADNQHFALKNSDVALGSNTAIGVSSGEEDTFFAIAKDSATEGGVTLRALAEDGGGTTEVMTLIVYGGTPDTTDTATSTGLVTYYISEHDGANALVNTGDTANIFAIKDRRAGGFSAHFLIKGNGDIHVTNTTLAALDDYPDALLMRAGRAATAPVGSPLHDDYQHLIAEYAPVLEERRIMFFERDGAGRITGAMNNVMPSAMLAWDGLFQHHQRIAALEGEIVELRNRLEAGRN